MMLDPRYLPPNSDYRHWHLVCSWQDWASSCSLLASQHRSPKQTWVHSWWQKKESHERNSKWYSGGNYMIMPLALWLNLSLQGLWLHDHRKRSSILSCTPTTVCLLKAWDLSLKSVKGQNTNKTSEYRQKSTRYTGVKCFVCPTIALEAPSS